VTVIEWDSGMSWLMSRVCEARYRSSSDVLPMLISHCTELISLDSHALPVVKFSLVTQSHFQSQLHSLLPTRTGIISRHEVSVSSQTSSSRFTS